MFVNIKNQPLFDKKRYDILHKNGYAKDMKETILDIVRKKIMESPYSRTEIARIADVQQASLHRFLTGAQGLSAISILRLIRVLGGEIIFPKEQQEATIHRMSPNAPSETVGGDNLKTIGVYDVAGAGPAVSVNELEPLFTVTAPPVYFRLSDYAIKVDGHSMEPLIPYGSVVGIKLHTPFVANELYAARIPYEGLVIKRVGVDREREEFIFKSENSNKNAYPDFRLAINEAEEIIVGRVVWVMTGY